MRESVNEADMRMALQGEINYFANLVGNRTVKSIFFGGGTPSLMSAKTVETVIDKISSHWTFSEDIEISLEANPTSVEAHKFSEFSYAGINRVSLGIQALSDNDLISLGREHSVSEALSAIELSQKYFKRSNFDLIYARMGQSIGDWEKELTDAIELANGHLSLYQLTIEKGTPFYGRWSQGKLIIPSEEIAAEMYEMTNMICADAGYPAYEISNHAKIGEESRHNLTYWKYDDYIGIGAGAHGRITYGGNTYATQQNKKPETWLKIVNLNGHATKIMDPLSQKEMAEEMIMMGLRLKEGIDRNEFEKRIGRSIENFTAMDRLDYLKAQGFLDRTAFQLTEKGRPLLNQILGQILT